MKKIMDIHCPQLSPAVTPGKKRLLRYAALAAFVFLSLQAAWAGITGERIIVQGMVNTILDDRERIISVVLVTPDYRDAYNIQLTENGMRLGREMAGKMVEVTGEVTSGGLFDWLEVERYQELDERVKKM